MKIAVMKDTLTVVHLENEMWFTEHGLRASNFLDATLNEDNCDIIHLIPTDNYTPPTIPAFFTSYGYTFENNQFVINQHGEEKLQSFLQFEKQRIKDLVVEAAQIRLDVFARTRNYDGILSAATYATSTVPKFQQEGQYAVEARDQTWAKLYEILAEVEAGTRPVPTSYADIEPELPVLAWPV